MPSPTTRTFCAALMAIGPLLAVGAAGGSAHAQPAQGPQPYASAWPAGADATDAMAREHRRARLRQRIVTGKMQGWLSREETHVAFQTLRAIEERERELRREGGGALTAAGRDEIDRRIDDLAQSLRWAHARGVHGHAYRPH